MRNVALQRNAGLESATLSEKLAVGETRRKKWAGAVVWEGPVVLRILR